MPSLSQHPISLFRTIVLAGVIAFLIASFGLPMPAQNSVPPTAVQAAKIPQFAKRLAHSAPRPASKPTTARQASRNGPPQGGDIYDNGPINGNTDAWTINFGFSVSDTFTVSSSNSGTMITGMSFGAWLYAGDTLNQAELSITSEPNGGTSYFDQTVQFTQGACTSNQYSYNVCAENTTFNGPTLNAGTYWVNLQNAQVPSEDPVYWDENSGVGCQSSGCPSQASNNEVGTIPSESFTMLGSNGSPTCFGTEGNLQVLFNFTQQQGGSENGVVIDQAGNLYGANPSAGTNGAGFAFKLARLTGWLLDPLFNFFGGNTGGEPTGGILGPNGSLYGGAQGGIQNCGSGGSQYCGLVFNLTPQATACKTSLCYWTENVPYRFTSDADGSGVINVSAYDQAGNLYGTTTAGGTNDLGTVFELSPSGGGWTKSILYAFAGGNDGRAPTQVLVGNDGNLYGIAAGGVFHNGVVFQLTPSGGKWTQSIVHPFGSEGDSSIGYLVQDGAGNLYGIAHNEGQLAGEIFALLKTGAGWGFSQYAVHHNSFDYLNNLTIDAAGNLYGTGYDGSYFRGSWDKPPLEYTHDSYIFKASYANGTWGYEDLDYLNSQYLDSGGSLALDASGNLYGATGDCGTYNSGTVWQLSP